MILDWYENRHNGLSTIFIASKYIPKKIRKRMVYKLEFGTNVCSELEYRSSFCYLVD